MEVLPGLRLSDHDGYTRRGAEAHGPEGYRSPEGHGSMVETDSSGPSPRAERFEEQLADARAARRDVAGRDGRTTRSEDGARRARRETEGRESTRDADRSGRADAAEEVPRDASATRDETNTAVDGEGPDAESARVAARGRSQAARPGERTGLVGATTAGDASAAGSPEGVDAAAGKTTDKVHEGLVASPMSAATPLLATEVSAGVASTNATRGAPGTDGAGHTAAGNIGAIESGDAGAVSDAATGAPISKAPSAAQTAALIEAKFDGAELAKLAASSDPSGANPAATAADVASGVALDAAATGARRSEHAAGVELAAATSGAETRPALQSPALENAAQILRQVRVGLSSDLREANIQLAPESLGRVSIRLRVEDGGLVADVRAQSPHALAALEHHAPELKAALAQGNVEPRSLSFALFDNGANRGDGANRGSEHDGARRRHGSFPHDSSDLPIEPASLERALARRLSANGVDTYA